MKTTLSTVVIAGIFVAGIFPITIPVASQNNGVNRADIVTEDFFSGIISKSEDTCPGKSFYTRVAFLAVIEDYPQFARSGSLEDSKREIAAFFAHVTYATDHLCHIEALDKQVNCDVTNTEYPCVANKRYYGRGPLQVAWNSNYGAAGKSIGFDGLGNPDIVANDTVISFKTALWFWMKYVHAEFAAGKGFGGTIRAINSPECEDETEAQVIIVVGFYTDYCNQLGVTTGGNLRCYIEPKIVNDTKRLIGPEIYNNLVLKMFGLHLR